ncbi:hypothetical protein ACFSKU_19860 [Pontibacter silvestris]|uniref:Uncharacterized protein n=1 Tax=Pontibacter silvestris TaxID=2305183 RepID=A0ABW4X3B9_9BACT|nr:hypothetical protein [Pontibacter silvestris]MCC9134857.1 hypothetical protein [Pontibacter silvestris]
MAVLLTYDVSEKQTEVKNGMKAIGYQESWSYGDHTISLPDASLWKDGINRKQPIDDLNSIVLSINTGLQEEEKIRVERAVVVEFDFDSGWWAIAGAPHKG